ncbi:putative AraC-family transcriptional regulator [Pseudomonas reidholzensis]|uniref:Putative AraC-family transcriptional regulator n=1 Tax=Pseudomonas reidholzensis TaxID=1785162 RepID=A0A383RSI3_9PSED|nr:helix-turn-helix transcriptional regulator [Pseudomonas reidholzensis]SYX90037.1 putative AraC-family transcriptional regulator [Pseudomonas reidholzensis]
MSNSRSTRHRLPPLPCAAYAPSSDCPLRCTLRTHVANTEVELHQHPWAQMVFSSRGVIRVHTGRKVFTVPPWRAVWIPSGTSHTATIIEDARLHSLYLDVDTGARCLAAHALGWAECRVLEVQPLLRELVVALAEEDLGGLPSERYGTLLELALLEIRKAAVLSLGIAVPSERRLSALCDAFLEDPRVDRSLSELSRDVGASVSTINRLFKSEMGCAFSDWRKQALLAETLALAAKGCSMSQIASALGYSSLSSFSFMVTQLVGMPPSKLLKGAKPKLN